MIAVVMSPLAAGVRVRTAPPGLGGTLPEPTAVDPLCGLVLSAAVTDLPAWMTLVGVIFGFQSISIGLTVGLVLVYSEVTGESRILRRLAFAFVLYVALTAATVLSLEVLVRASAFVLIALITISVTVPLVITWRLATIPIGHGSHR